MGGHVRGDDQAERVDTELAGLRRLAIVDELLTTLVDVLDLREVLTRVSEIASRVLSHDAITLLVLTDDCEHVLAYGIADLAPAETPSHHPVPDGARECQPCDRDRAGSDASRDGARSGRARRPHGSFSCADVGG